MSCPHPSLIQSTTYPIGTRCSQCGASAESILSECRGRLGTVQQELQEFKEALVRVLALESETARMRVEQESTEASLRAYLAEQRKQLSEQLAQTEALSKENVRLTWELREAENASLANKNALAVALEELNTIKQAMKIHAPNVVFGRK